MPPADPRLGAKQRIPSRAWVHPQHGEWQAGRRGLQPKLGDVAAPLSLDRTGWSIGVAEKQKHPAISTKQKSS